jgi:hypothetical protein
MATDGALRFWSFLDEHQTSRGEPLSLRSRLAADIAGQYPVTIIVNAATPLVPVTDQLRAAMASIDAEKLERQHADPEEGRRWREAFNEAREAETLTPNAACRLILVPLLRPTRRIFTVNANVELRVDPADAAKWFDDIDATDSSWPSLSDLIQRFDDREASPEARRDVTVVQRAVEQRANAGRTGFSAAPHVTSVPPAAPTIGPRADANRIALRAVRAILDAATDLDLSLDGTPVHVTVERLPPEPWPANGLEGLDPTIDGPLPGAVRLDCRWQGGSTKLVLSASWWQTFGRYRHLIGIRARIAVTKRELMWITVGRPIQLVADGPSAALPSRRANNEHEAAKAAR